ncbi:Crp/Fnr family transcriptional regulator [Cytophagales bacterium LB-30]|uniref:Crp/Fnr family transcriptional regulator n=1 Tax=Shiella aurantiaca TaxID=3058365 RepID=A0ABT8F374_9BACT|nr:Crp/Fnr family transcriptional regulator [Shiella aurantiaca]MDN4164809.1 Crp/Fnr family transcriptional regulator [Shiella aurantiaca]
MNQKEEIVQLLNRYFPEFEEPLRQEIMLHAHVRKIRAGQFLMKTGKAIDSIPLILEGIVKVSREDDAGNELFIYHLESGDACAISLVCSSRQNKQSEISAEVVEDVTILEVNIFNMDSWMMKYPTWYRFVLGTYQRRFEELLNTLDSIAFQKMDERLVKYLKTKAETLNSLNLPLTHQQIAQELNSSREVISRLLKKLEQRGQIQLNRNEIRIIDLF